MAAARTALGRSSAALVALGPQATLDRGYAIVRRADDGLVVRDPKDAPVGDLLAITVARGDLAARVEVDRGPAGNGP
jgi:exodeoxyribonuclease VII large subunit